jgi:hypothetical protein
VTICEETVTICEYDRQSVTIYESGSWGANGVIIYEPCEQNRR